MPKLTINGTEVEVAAGTTVKQACEAIGIQIPHFCAHDKLSTPANCRMCVVEVEGRDRLVTACSAPVEEWM